LRKLTLGKFVVNLTLSKLVAQINLR